MNAVKKIVIALNLPQIVALLIVFGRHVVQAMTQNPWFPNLAALLTTTSNDLDALDTAEATALTRAKGSAATRDLKKKAVVDDLHQLKAGVEAVIAANLAQGAAIADSSGMAVKKSSGHAKQNLTAVMGPAPDEVLVRAKAVRGACYEWQYSLDGKVWVAAGTTTVASTSVLGLAAGTPVSFRFRTTLKRTTSDWSQTITFLPH